MLLKTKVNNFVKADILQEMTAKPLWISHIVMIFLSRYFMTKLAILNLRSFLLQTII